MSIAHWTLPKIHSVTIEMGKHVMVRIFLFFAILITLTSSVSGKIFPGITSVTSALLVLTLVLSETNQPTKTVWKLFFWVKAFATFFWVIIATLIDSNQRNLLFHKKFLSYFHFLSNTFICSQENRDNEKKKRKKPQGIQKTTLVCSPFSLSWGPHVLLPPLISTQRQAFTETAMSVLSCSLIL